MQFIKMFFGDKMHNKQVSSKSPTFFGHNFSYGEFFHLDLRFQKQYTGQF